MLTSSGQAASFYAMFNLCQGKDVYKRQVVIAAGIPLDMSGNTNILKVETVGGYGR